MSHPIRRRALARWKQVLFAAVPTLALLAVFEIAVRIHAGGRIETITGVAGWKTADWEGLTYHWDRFHPSFGWTNQPGYTSGEQVPFRVTINNQGLRGATDYAVAAPSGVARLAVFGDSTTFGEEVDDDETVPAYLEAALRDSEVLNFGVHGYGLGQMMLRLEEEGFAFAPDHVIIVALIPQDVGRTSVHFFTHAKPVFSVDEQGLRIDNWPVRSDAELPWLVRSSFAAAWLWARPSLGPPATRSGAIVAGHAILQRIGRACAEREIGWSLVLIATPETLDLLPVHAALREQVDVMRVHLGALANHRVDLIPMLTSAYAARGPELTEPRGHWSSEGNRLIAEGIAAALRERGLPPRR